MRRFTQAILTVCFLFVGSLITEKAHATHCAGGQLTYVWLQDSTYKFTFKFYRDCTGSSSVGPFNLCYFSTCGNSGSIAMTQVGAATQVVTPCPGIYTACDLSPNTNAANPNYQEYVYEATVTNLARCNSWHFFTFLGSRNASTNLFQSNTQNWFAETIMNNQNFQGNSSPQFTVRPVPFCCINQAYTFNNGASDPNNDSLSYQMIMPRAAAGCTSTTFTDLAFDTPPAGAPPYNLTTNPFPTNNTFNIDPITGQMSFTADYTGRMAIAVLVKEWRNGVLIGSVLRDMQIVVKASGCSQSPINAPQPGTSSGIVFTTTPPYQACARQSFTLCTRLSSPDTSAWLAVTSNNTIIAPGSVMSYTGIGTDTVFACLTWTPSSSDTGLRTFTYTVRDTNCLSNGGTSTSQTFSISLFINPVTVASNDTTICYGGTATVSALGGSGFHWTVLPGGSPASSIFCDTCRVTQVTPTVTTRYLVTSAGTSFCNGNHDTVVVTVAPIPTFNAGPDTTTCIHNSLQLNANVALPAGTYSILWTPATYLNNPNVTNPVTTPTGDLTYVIRVTPNGSGAAACALYDTLRVNVVQGYDLLTPDTFICKGASVQIRTAGDARYSYTWTPTIGVSAANIANPLITPDTSHLYTVTAHFPGCGDSVRHVFIDVQPIPTVFIGADKTLCYGDTVHMDMSTVSPAYNYDYSWSPAGAFDDPFRLHPAYTGLASAAITLTVKTREAQCSGTATVNYTIIPANFLTLSADTALCPGDTAHITVGGVYSSLHWINHTFISDTTSGTPIVWPLTTTTYTVIGRDVNACRDTASVLITIHPGALLSLPDSVTIYPGDTYAINPNGNCLYFQWFPPAGLSNPNIANPIASPAVNTRYFVTASTEAGCSAHDSIDVNVNLDSYIDVPNAFSPGSQPNSILKIVHTGAATVQKFRIFNRWGAEMFSTTNINEGWDGTLGGSPQPMGVYVYIVEASTPSGRHFYKQGNITLIR